MSPEHKKALAQSLKKRRKEIEKIMGEHDCDFATARQIRKEIADGIRTATGRKRRAK